MQFEHTIDSFAKMFNAHVIYISRISEYVFISIVLENKNVKRLEHKDNWESKMVSNNVSYYTINITSNLSYNTKCWMKYGEGIPNNTSIVYPEELLDFGLFFSMLTTFGGVFLNLLVIITLLHDRVIRLERFTPIIISIATCDLLFSAIVLPINSTRCYYR